MIHDLDKTLATFLKRELPPGLASQVAISFAPPDNQFPPTSVKLPAIDLFLYDVRENLDLRSNEEWIERQSNGMALKHRASVRVDCAYLITAWPSDSAPDPAEDEHRLLGAVMLSLLRYSKLPADVLQGSLQSQDLPLPTSVLRTTQLQSLGEFWQAIGGKPKAMLSYTVTISAYVHDPVEAGPLVIERPDKVEE